MSKQEFLAQLENGLKGLPKAEIDERVVFYSEMIDDLVDEGLSEEDAVKKIGNAEDVVAQIVVDNHYTKQLNPPKRKLRTWEIVLLIIGLPLWGSLLITAIFVAFALYVSAWAVIVSLWAVFVSLAASAAAVPIFGVVSMFRGHGLVGLAIISAGVISAGLAIFAFFGCKSATDGAILLTKKAVLWVKNRLAKKEEAK